MEGGFGSHFQVGSSKGLAFASGFLLIIGAMSIGLAFGSGFLLIIDALKYFQVISPRTPKKNNEITFKVSQITDIWGEYPLPWEGPWVLIALSSNGGCSSSSDSLFQLLGCCSASALLHLTQAST